ncbi:ATP-binding protein [Streptomyces sp. 4N509B]|uniref:ATP-binding protein n=1 Tax=Streptomyces sp. 4N509B TaxID=3457413 RepID=UPI003FD4A7BD
MSLSSALGDAVPLYRWTDHAPDALFQARAALRRAAERYGLTAQATRDAVSAAAELMANAVEHARGPYELHVRRQARVLICQVVDHDPAIPQLSPIEGVPEPEVCSLDDVEERGRGLLMVHELSCGVWGMRTHGRVKIAWCAIAVE